MKRVTPGAAPRSAAQRRAEGRRRIPAARERYHHGDLQQALIAAALRILETGGAAALSLRAAAREAGVSQAAPYRHFADKEALLAAVAAASFRALSAAMREATAPLGGDLNARFRMLGLTYIRFAVAHPARFRLMFGRDVGRLSVHPGLKQAADETFALLVAGIERGQQAGLLRAGEPRELAMAAWAMVHGLSALLVDGQLSPGTQALEAFAFRVVQYLFLGVRSEPLAR
jgi:AcrR family transcriptional regulator